VSRNALIIGANGRLGRVLSAAFLAAGWRVQAQVRRTGPEPAAPGLRWVRVPIDDAAQLAQAVGAADVVVHAANPLYPRWQQEARPLAQRAADTARRLNAVLMFPGNVYNFGARMPELLLESTPMQPTTRKGRIRVEIEERLRDEARRGLRCIVIRAGDFFGGPGRGSWFDLVIAKALPNGRAVYPGRMDAVHAWAFLPDLARAFVALAERRADAAVFETVHFPGHAPTGTQLLECMSRSARRLGLLAPHSPLRRATMPWWLLHLGGLIVPMWSELAEMQYLWDIPHRLSGERLGGLIGTVPNTPLEEAMDATLSELFGPGTGRVGR
jgi:nucleoside-diphosphate-sugar epimerase